jgi:hypothetical protein
MFGITLPQIAGGIAGVATIATIVWSVFRYVAVRVEKTPEEIKQDIQHQLNEEEKKAKETGRPQ